MKSAICIGRTRTVDFESAIGHPNAVKELNTSSAESEKAADENFVYRAMSHWTFLDPANLICILSIGTAAVLSFLAFFDRKRDDLFMLTGLYLCLFAFIRGYFFFYYHGRALTRGFVWLILLLSLLASGILWYDRSSSYLFLKFDGTHTWRPSLRMLVSAILHFVAAGTILIHLCLPRRWLIRKRTISSGEAPMHVRE